MSLKNKISIFLKIKHTFNNWYGFLFDHFGFGRRYSGYRLKDGLKINLLRVDRNSKEKDFSTDLLMDVFVRKDYGEFQDNMVIVDIGANIGAFSIYCTYNKNNVCYAFEPEENNFVKLQENVLSNKLDNKIKAFKLGVSNNCEDKKLYKFESIAHSFLRSGGDFDLVHCIDLKTIIEENKLDKIDYLKIDCEGAEFEILYSTGQDILKKIKVICVEYHNYSEKENYNGESLLEYLKNQGFKIISHELRQEGLLGIVKAVRE